MTLQDRIRELIAETVGISQIGKSFVVLINGHIIWRGKDRESAEAVIEICFKPDLSAFADALLEEVAKTVELETLDSDDVKEDVDAAYNKGVNDSVSAIRLGKGK